MAGIQKLQELVQSVHVSKEIFALRPDYRALILAIENIPQGSSDSTSEKLLQEAETSARADLAKKPVTEFPHIAAWRDAYNSFGAKPKKFRNSAEALVRRAEGGLPRVNRLTDIYNAISVKYQIPLGGEDLDKYSGAARLIRATGNEKFETTAAGETVVENPDAGEPVWCDDVGVTCRRWNWRQGPRTALTDETTRVLFILDALSPLTDETLNAAADELASAFQALSPEVHIARRLISAAQE